MTALHAWPDDESADPIALGGRQQRKNRRVHNPKLAIGFRGKLFETVNWSLGGCLIEGYDGALVPGDAFDIEYIGPAGRSPWPVLVQARVVRVGGESGMQMAAQFLALSIPAFDILEGVLLRRAEYRVA